MWICKCIVLLFQRERRERDCGRGKSAAKGASEQIKKDKERGRERERGRKRPASGGLRASPAKKRRGKERSTRIDTVGIYVLCMYIHNVIVEYMYLRV